MLLAFDVTVLLAKFIGLCFDGAVFVIEKNRTWSWRVCSNVISLKSNFCKAQLWTPTTFTESM